MKKTEKSKKVIITVLLSLALCIPAVSLTAAPSGNELGRFEFDANPLGFLQFGPIFNLGVRVGPVTFLDFHFRYQYLGVIYWAAETDNFYNDDKPLPNSGGIGIRINNVVKLKHSPHAWYLGMIWEHTWGGTDIYIEYDDTTWRRIWQGFAMAANGGFRWRFKSGFYLNLGGILGFHYQHTAEFTHGERSDNPEGFRFFGMLELGLGVEFPIK